jgi:hypothetical protein
MPIKVKLPNGTTLAASATSDVSLNNFNPRARTVHIINGLVNHPLLSCGQMCDAGYKVLFDEGKAIVIEANITVHGRVTMDGQLDHTTGLWTVPLDNKVQKWANEYKKQRDEITSNVYEISKIYDAIQYIHSDAGSPAPSTFIKAIEAIEAENFMTWPTLMAQYVKKYLDKSEGTKKGHMSQMRKNVRSTRPKPKHKAAEEVP